MSAAELAVTANLPIQMRNRRVGYEPGRVDRPVEAAGANLWKAAHYARRALGAPDAIGVVRAYGEALPATVAASSPGQPSGRRQGLVVERDAHTARRRV